MKFRNILLLIGILGLAIIVILNIHQFGKFLHLLKTINIFVLLLIVAVQLFSYYLNARYYRSILSIFNHGSIGLYRLFQAALAANFVNYIIPSAGIAGAGIFSQALKPDVPRGQGVLIQIMRYALSALAVLVALPIGIGLVILTRPPDNNLNKVAITASLIILAIAIVIVVVVQQEVWLKGFIKRMQNRFKKLSTRFDANKIDTFVREFYVGYHAMSKQKRGMLVPFGWSIVYVAIEMFTLYLVFLAFGVFVNPGIVIMGYVMANITSFIGGSLFSFGVFELGMLGTFVALGVPFVLALSITIVYRVMNLLIGIPPGFVFYRRILKA